MILASNNKTTQQNHENENVDCSPETVTEFICCLRPTLSDFTQYYTKEAKGPNNHPDGLLHLGKQLFSSWKKRDRVLCNQNT